MTIAVRGTDSVETLAERARVTAVVSIDGPQAVSVVHAVTTSVERLRAGLDELHDVEQGPVTWYRVAEVTTGSHRPWFPDGEKRPLVFRATALVEVYFVADAGALGRWVVATSDLPGFSVTGVSWELSPGTRSRAERAARQTAIAHAVEQANDYAEALGLSSVEVREIDDRSGGTFPQPRVFAMAEAAPDGGDLFMPPVIEVTTSVDATFVAVR
ncbi:MAG: SIMPL domain-containing protein [Aeromicrobium sp.]